jgi:hypothetical protein
MLYGYIDLWSHPLTKNMDPISASRFFVESRSAHTVTYKCSATLPVHTGKFIPMHVYVYTLRNFGFQILLTVLRIQTNLITDPYPTFHCDAAPDPPV